MSWQKDNARATEAGRQGVVLPARGTPERRSLSLASDREEQHICKLRCALGIHRARCVWCDSQEMLVAEWRDR